jgi:Ca2+-binding RTX toxin-like protein
MNDTTNMIIVLIVVGILSAAVIAMLLAAPRVLRANAPDVIGGDGDDLLTGGKGANRFVCGGGNDTITDFNPAEGDTKTADCENF